MALLDQTSETDPAIAEAVLMREVAGPANFDVHPATVNELAELAGEGYNVHFAETTDLYAFSPEQQQSVDDEIAELEQRTVEEIMATGKNPLLLLHGRKAFEKWQPLTKRAIALKNIYEPYTETLGEGIDPEIYNRPLFTAYDDEGEYIFSAKDVLVLQKGEEKATSIVDQYQQFIETAIDEPSRRIWQGARDGAGVRTRASCAMDEVAEHLRTTKQPGDKIVTASLACGAASPVYELMQKLNAHGLEVEKSILADMDPMALASAFSLAEKEGVADKVSLQLESLVDMQTLEARDLTEFIEPGSVDVVDLLGLFEYFPRPLAVGLLQEVRKIMKPGGIIVFGNMLNNRPQQTFFSEVSLWPPLEQRSLRELFSIIDEAGIKAKEDAAILLPPQGVYAVVSIKIPNEK